MAAIPELATFSQQYRRRHLTLIGYIIKAIAILELEEIDLVWLSVAMDVTPRSLRDAVARIRANGAIDIPTVRSRKHG